MAYFTEVADQPNSEAASELSAGTFADRLRALIGSGSANAFARECSVGESSLRQYLAGGVPGLDKVVQIARAKNVSVQWLATGEGLSEAKTSVNQPNPHTAVAQNLAPMRVDPETGAPEGFVAVRHLDVRASAGSGIANTQDGLGHTSQILFRDQWLRMLGIRPQNAEFVQAEGDSMEPTIKDGDMMLLDRGYGRVINGKIYVLVVNDLVIVKRVRILATGGLILISDNDRYEPEPISPVDVQNLKIEARVAWFGRVI